MATITKQLLSPAFDVDSTLQSVVLIMAKQQTKLYISLLISAFALSAGVSA